MNNQTTRKPEKITVEDVKMEKIHAYQINPEHQTSDLFYITKDGKMFYDDDFWDDIGIVPRRGYCHYMPDEMQEIYDNLNNGVYADDDELLSGKLENAAEQIKNYNWDYLSQLETFCAVLLFITGKKYVSKEIHGSCQGDWQVIVYPVDEYTDEEIKMYEALYFNTGTEWSVEESTPDYDGNIKAYCFGNTPDEIRKEIADYTGNAPEEIVLHKFVGYTKIPQYRII